MNDIIFSFISLREGGGVNREEKEEGGKREGEFERG